MANFKDQLNIAKELNKLTRERMKNEKFIDSTLDDRVSILNNIVQNKISRRLWPFIRRAIRY